MTATSLVIALLVGIVIGVAGYFVVPRGRVPWWVTPAVGTGAALFGALIAPIAGRDVGEFSLAGILVQLVFGASGVGFLATIADRRALDRRGRPDSTVPCGADRRMDEPEGVRSGATSCR